MSTGCFASLHSEVSSSSALMTTTGTRSSLKSALMKSRQPSQWDLIATTSVTSDSGIVVAAPVDQCPCKVSGALRSRGESKDRALNSDVTGFDDRFDRAPVAAPPTGHRVDVLRDDLGLFDRQIASHGVVVKGPDGRRLDDVESSEVPASGASVARSHSVTVLGDSSHHSKDGLLERRGCTS